MSDTPYDIAMQDIQSGIEGLIAKAEAAPYPEDCDRADMSRFDGQVEGLKAALKLVRTIRLGGDPTPLLTSGKPQAYPKIKVLPADPVGSKKIGFMCYETPLDDKTPDYDAEVLRSTDEADKYRSHHGIPYKSPEGYSFTVLPVLPDLVGRPWDQYALNMTSSLRPSDIRVVGPHEGLTLDCYSWRVTVFLKEDNRTIYWIEQEVNVGCVGAQHGHGLHKYARGEDPTPCRMVFNPRGLKKLELYSGSVEPKEGTPE